MATVCHPALAVPEHIVTQENILEVVQRFYHAHPRLKTILRIIKNSKIEKRHFALPPDELQSLLTVRATDAAGFGVEKEVVLFQ